MQREVKRLKSPSDLLKPAQFLLAAEQGDLEKVRSYIEARGDDVADMDIVREDGCNALMLAAMNGYAEVAYVLVTESSISLNAENVAQETALNLAAYRGNIQIVLTLLAAGATISEKYRRDVLNIIEEKNHLNIHTILIRAQSRLEMLQTLKLEVLSNRHVSEVLALSQKKYDIFCEVTDYLAITSMLNVTNVMQLISRLTQKFDKMPASEIKELKDDSGYHYHVANKFSFFLNRDSAKTPEFTGNNGYVNRGYTDAEQREPKYAVKWVRDRKTAERETKYNRQFANGDNTFWFESQIPHKRFGILYPWRSGLSLESIKRRTICDLPELHRLQMLTAFLEQLNFLHQKFYVHHDVKPANVVIDTIAVTAHLIDPGSAKRYTSQSGFADDIYGLKKIVIALFPDAAKTATPIREAMHTLMAALTQTSKKSYATCEQALEFCKRLLINHRQLTSAQVQTLAAETVERTDLSYEDVIRGRYLTF